MNINTRYIIGIKTKGDDLEITYKRNDIKKPENYEEKALITHIEQLLRYVVDNGFNVPTKEVEDGNTSKK